MPAKILPPKHELKKMLDQGMTHREIAEAVSRQTGRPVNRSTVSAAITRAGLSGTAKKYPETLPWTVREKHLTHYAARMLRLLGRRRAGVQNSAEMDQRLDAWLRQLEESHSVVVYLPETEEGFFYVDGSPTAGGVPINPEFSAEDVLHSA